MVTGKDISRPIPFELSNKSVPFSQDTKATKQKPVSAILPGTKDRVRPSLRLLFTFLTIRDVVFILLPAVLLSIAVGTVPAVMSKAVGNSFDAFASYNVLALPSDQVSATEKHDFLHKILRTVYTLLGLAAGTTLLSTISVSVWICLGERLASRLRTELFVEIMARQMDWFDTGMGLCFHDPHNEEDQEDQDISPAGLMAKVARESDDVRVAVSCQLGDVVQHITTAIASLALALYSSWNLTLVVLASIPAILLLTIVTEIGASPSLQAERLSTAKATGMIERVVQAISTVKAFNAQRTEANRFQTELGNGCRSYRRTLIWWASRFGITGCLVFAMFVQGFWYGSHLVQRGKLSPGQVMTVFMASLLVSGMLTEIVQALTYLQKGKIGAANIINLINSSTDDCARPSASDRPTSGLTGSERSSTYALQEQKSNRTSSHLLFSDVGLTTPPVLEYDYRKAKAVPMQIDTIPTETQSTRDQSRVSHHRRQGSQTPGARLIPTAMGGAKKLRVQGLRRISPVSCQGEVHFRNISFSYPSRPNVPVLRDVNLYFPASEMTYVVGGSGSGKSTIAQLLLRLYQPTKGSIQIDDQTVSFLDPAWCRNHIGAVSQNPIIFDMSIHENVAIGLIGREPGTESQDVTSKSSSDDYTNGAIPTVSRTDVESACRTALLHDFVRDLPDGYDTLLGGKGTNLSGGQRQRLAIARAKLRDPSILILDEATSALDPTTRMLVHEAIKVWRRGKTTIVITHDLSQIEPTDFLYLLEEGLVAQQGYRSDLQDKDGAFRRLATSQCEEDVAVPDDKELEYSSVPPSPGKRHSLRPPMFHRQSSKQSLNAAFKRQSKRYTAHRSLLGWVRDGDIMSEHLSFLVAQKLDHAPSHLKPLRLAERQVMQTYYDDAEAMQLSGTRASARRANLSADGTRTVRRAWNHSLDDIEIAKTNSQALAMGEAPPSMPTTKKVVTILWRTIPNRALLAFGMLLCVVAGAMTPIFSFILAQLLSTMGRPNADSLVIKWSLLVLLIAVLEGVFSFARFLLMETVADEWIFRLRNKSFVNILAQERSWFDEGANSVDKVCQSVVKDAEDARNLVGQIIGQLALVTSMITLGLTWALVVGWQLTLVGVAFGPVFIVAMFFQSRIISFYEGRNKMKRERVSESFYAMLSNIRSIRSMGLEPLFGAEYSKAVSEAQRCGMHASIFSGFGHGLSDALTYIAEALMFFTGAKLMIAGSYNFRRMIQVFNLIIFAVTFAAQMLTFLPGLSKSMRALVDLDHLVTLSTVTRESQGTLMPADIQGRIRFHDVSFAYALRPMVSVLSKASLEIKPGECVAVVGSSGCGKSTIASLLQRLYEPSSGSILLDDTPLQSISIPWLREHISVVSQNPNLFDLSIGENIAYGANASPTDCKLATEEDIRAAARAANIDDFIRTLPRSYESFVGAGETSKLSGGQAQRIAIARAVIRIRSKILILDECTSALDLHNQQAIVETLMSGHGEIRQRKITTLVITHNTNMMRRCDRIIVLQNGQVVEQGSYATLMAVRKGYFASLARGGEWTG